MITFYLVCLPYWIFVDYIFVGKGGGRKGAGSGRGEICKMEEN
jgi:hypothetical protein